ncbi:MAG: rhodanese-like domain-containing protein [Betaproteobacteria bacterium]|nr:rhodanese-like domain-containing protein [Betaproteobacteria bacterium]
MKFLLDNWLLIAMACVSGGMLLWPHLRGGAGAGAVNVAEAVRLINREKGVLIDVSEPNEFASAHAGGSKNIPFGQIESSKDLPSNKALPIILVCPSGARAGRAAGLLRAKGYEKATSLAGGLTAWREANLPMDKASSATA